MKNKKILTALALSLSLSLVSCDDDKTEANSPAVEKAAVEALAPQQSVSNLLSYIPADTPVLVYYMNDSKYPIPQKLMDKMDKMLSSLGEVFKTSFLEGYNGYMKKAGHEDESKDMTELVNKWMTDEGFKKLGLAMGETEFAFYTVDLFPVIRLNLAKGHSMGEVMDELMAKVNEEKADSAIKKTVDGATVYQMGDKEFQIMLSLKGDALVASFAPTRKVNNLMPKLFGFEKPTKALPQSNIYHDTLNKYHYMSNSLVWINFRDLADYFVNPNNHPTPMLDLMKVQDNVLSADCKTETLGIIDKFPRMVSGTTVLNDTELDSHMIIELADGLGSKLASMMGRIPTVNTDVALRYGFSFDINAAKTVLQEFVSNIETTPYKCEMLANMNNSASMMKAKLNQPLPPFVGNFKGFNMVIDELDLDLTKTDPNEMVENLKGKVLLAVDNPEAIKGMAEMMLPEIQKLGLEMGGDAVSIAGLIPVSGSQIPVNLDFVFMAMGDETIGVSLGEGTNIDLKQEVSEKGESHLLNFSIKADLYKNIFAGISDLSEKMPAEMQKQFAMQKLMMNDLIWWNSESGSVDFTDRGFEIFVDYQY